MDTSHSRRMEFEHMMWLRRRRIRGVYMGHCVGFGALRLGLVYCTQDWVGLGTLACAYSFSAKYEGINFIDSCGFNVNDAND